MTTVRAHAFVRSRSGRCLRDGDPARPEQTAVLMPAPDLMHQAVTRLEELGFTVDAVDATVAFHGDEETFGAVFGGVPGDIPVLAADPLGGLLHSVVAAPTAQPAARGGTLFAGGADNLLGGDLLLGELGETLSGGPTTVPAARTSFPAATADDATRAGGAALQAWAASEVRKGLSEHIAWNRELRKGRAVTAALVERGGPDQAAWRVAALRDLLRDPAAAGRAPRLPISSVGTSLVRDRGGWPASGGERACQHYFAAIRPVRPGVVDRIADPPAGAQERGAWWKSLRADFTALDAAAASIRRMDPEQLDLYDAESSKDLALALTAMDKAIAGGRSFAAARIDLVGLLRTFIKWEIPRSRKYTGVWAGVESALREHGMMVAAAFLAVGLRDIDVALMRHDDLAGTFWARPRRAVSRTVMSGSFSGGTGADLTADNVTIRDGVTALRPTHPDMLYVVAAGNNVEREATGRDSPSIDAVFGSGMDNVLVVGGCMPDDQGRWVAADSTHGYEIRVAATATAPARTAFVPDVCATTMGAGGGAVAYPSGPAAWETGRGSSFSTPVVAAVCSLVWAAFPGLTSAQVKQAVLAGAEALDGDRFHAPTKDVLGVQPRSEAVRSAKNRTARLVGRVSLEGALDAASKVSVDVALSRLLDAAPVRS